MVNLQYFECMGNANVREGEGKIVEWDSWRQYLETSLDTRHGQQEEAGQLGLFKSFGLFYNFSDLRINLQK